MRDQVILGVLAVVAGFAAGVVLFVPFVALSYRRRGGLSAGRFVLWAAALVYFWAIWSYTLLPLPEASYVCAGVNLDPLAFVHDLRGALARPGRTLTDPAVLQLVLNVVLFVPLGFFVRVLGGRGILTALVVGLGTSAFIETTQLTGVWGLHPCAYRVFDVVDLMTNTAGALAGSIIAIAVPRRHRGAGRAPDADAPRPVTRSRKLLAMLCDALAAVLVQVAVSVGVQVWLQYVARDRAAVVDGTVAAVAGNAVPIAAALVLVLATGRSVGDLAVQLRYIGGPVPAPPARVLRYLGGVGGWMLLGALPGGWGALSWAFAAASLVIVLTPVGARGLPGIVSGQRMQDARA